ncbi:MAG TPA: polysaccharide deacetylase family protein [Candidatus Bathyarchaeia archaeon]|nr:polysaccharide deacetylase family protein [Candidatus Bathyarchaeia archaeon]
MPDRKKQVTPTGWPDGKRLAVFVNIPLEGWTDDSAPGIGPMGNPLKPGYLDTQGQTWAKYGPTTGMPRLLDILRKKKVRATVYTSGIIAERYPELARRIADEGHELCGHSYAQNILPVYLDEKADKENIERCQQIITKASGKRITGWSSPRATPGLTTIKHLAEMDFHWHNDTFDSDMPRLEKFGDKKLVAIPFTIEINDMPMYVRYGNPPNTYTQVLRRVLEGWYSKHDDVGCFDVTVHAHVFGRPYGAVEFEEALDMITSLKWIWIPTHEEMSQLYLQSQ